MNFFAISSLLIVIETLALATFLFWKGRGKKLSVVWGWFCIVIAFWGWGGLKFSTTLSKQSSFFWWQIGYIAVILSPVTYSHFVFSYLGLKRKKEILTICYILAGIFLFFNLFLKDLFLGDLKFVFGEFYWHDWVKHRNLCYLIFYYIFHVVLVLFSLILLVKEFFSAEGVRRYQLKYFIIASIFGWLGPFGDFLIDFGISNIYPYSNFLICFFPPLIAYAIARYRLIDIPLAITRTGIFVSIYSLLLGFPFLIAYRMRPMLVGLFGINWWIIPLAVMTLLAMLVPFVYLYILRKAEDRLLREQRQYQTTLRQASQGMSRIRDLDRLLRLIVHVVTRTVHLKKGAIYLLDEQRGEYTLRAARDRGQPTTVFSIPQDSPLIAKLSSVREPLVYEEIKQRLQDYHDPALAKLEAQMKQIDSAVIVPSFTGDKLLGFIVLGEKRSGKLYSSDDLVVFSVLANQAALAIENAQFYEDIKRTQEQLFQAEKMATVGTMANGLSHQISNRLQALGFIAGDTLDTINLAGDKPQSQDIKDLLASVASALKRIQDNVKQGGEVVKGMLKYSRPGEAGFEPINLDKLFSASLEMAQYKVKLDTIDVIRAIPPDLPDFWGNSTQLQEVFFNLIDNAFDAITERKNDSREEEYKGKIAISALLSNDHLQIRFEDNGMGIRSEDQLKIFTPFFTTKTSSKKGTGLGLYVIQKIITDNHHGKIRTDSEYQRGTTFIIELPLRKES